jgi:hypothetical protein
MTCEELKDLYELYALGVLEGEEKAEADAHIGRGCEVCKRSLNDALVINTMLLSSASATPSRRLKRRVMASVGVERTGWGWAAALAAACMLVVALWLSVQERHRASELADARRSLMQISAQRDTMLQALSFLNQPETQHVGFSKGPHGNVFVNPRSGVLLISANLPALDPGKTFEMWLIPKGGAPRPAGLFQPTAPGSAFHLLPGPVDLSTLAVVAVTVEPEAGSASPTTTPIIAVPVGS